MGVIDAVAQGGMNPLSDLTAVTQVVGLGMSLFGGASAASDAKQAAQIQSNIAGSEQELEGQRYEAMQLSAKRQSLETLRNNQKLRANAVNTAVNQGAQFGSGLSGGLAEVQDQGAFALAGINKNLAFGENMFNINKDITNSKQQLAQVQGQMATDQGIASMGGALTKAGPTIGAIGQTGGSYLSSLNLGSGLMGGGSPSGYGNG